MVLYPSTRYSLLNLLGNMARGQRAHKGTVGSKQGKDRAGVGRVASTLPSLRQAPAKHMGKSLQPQLTGPWGKQNQSQAPM